MCSLIIDIIAIGFVIFEQYTDHCSNIILRLIIDSGSIISALTSTSRYNITQIIKVLIYHIESKFLVVKRSADDINIIHIFLYTIN